MHSVQLAQVLEAQPHLVAHDTPLISPPVSLHAGLNNVYGKAQYKKDNGVVKYLGQFSARDGCDKACKNRKLKCDLRCFDSKRLSNH